MKGKTHEYLAMKLDYSMPQKLRLDMQDYIKELVTTFPEKLLENIKCPWTTRLFNINDKIKLLDKQKKDIFYTSVMKCMFLAKRARPDILIGISFLSTQVMKSNEEDWKKTGRR